MNSVKVSIVVGGINIFPLGKIIVLLEIDKENSKFSRRSYKKERKGYLLSVPSTKTI